MIDTGGPYNGFFKLAENLYTDDAHIYRFAGMSITAYPQSAEVSNWAWLPDAQVEGDALFIGYDYTPAAEYRIKSLDLAGGGAETAILAEPGVTAYEVVGDSLFYSKPDGTWRKDLVTEEVSLYAADPAEIKAVR